MDAAQERNSHKVLTAINSALVPTMKMMGGGLSSS
jgi:hypothetical protein